MDSGFIDLDILLTRIRHAQSKAYFLDAVKAYKAGALRGALTSAWVALAYDLIAKYRELSALGDAAATLFLTSWDNATRSNDIPKLLQLEADILEDATSNTQVINPIARTHLKRLREDRHLCAHPAFSAEADLFEPSHELVRLHLVNAVEYVLSQEPLQGKAIFETYDIDVQSPGFPTDSQRIINYVEQRYLTRIRSQNISNFGTVLAKSLLKGVPPQWETHHHQIITSLVAVRDRANIAWPDITQTIVRLIDNLEPPYRPRAIAVISAFNDLWPRLQEPTRTVLLQTLDNINSQGFTDYRMLMGVTFTPFRDAMLELIDTLTQEQLIAAIAFKPLADFWDKALGFYSRSDSFRESESNFTSLITPFAGSLNQQQLNQLLNTIIKNGQNWYAAKTPIFLYTLLQNATPADLPDRDTRNSFHQHIYYNGNIAKYEKVFTVLQADGWLPAIQEEIE